MNIDVEISTNRNKELKDDYKSRHNNSVITSALVVYEKQASTLFTREVFDIARDKILDEQQMVVREIQCRGETHLFVVYLFLKANKQWDVIFRATDNYLQYSCKLFESEGIPYVNHVGNLGFPYAAKT